jgi:hypothetical protein
MICERIEQMKIVETGRPGHVWLYTFSVLNGLTIINDLWIGEAFTWLHLSAISNRIVKLL